MMRGLSLGSRVLSTKYFTTLHLSPNTAGVEEGFAVFSEGLKRGL